jgi:hypothetical protein
MAANQFNVWVYTMQEGGIRGKWSRYRFPWIIEHFAHLKDKLYCREGDRVHRVEEQAVFDDGESFTSTIQWPWLDFGRPGATKYMTGFDLVCDGVCTVEFGYDQTDESAFTSPFQVDGDTLPGQMIPMPVAAPTLSPRINFVSGQSWEWQSTQLYLQDHRAGV